MALMGGTSKGYGHSNSSGNRGRAYGILLLLAFGAAVMGVMLLHKLRERRVFELLLREKDRELLSLQFLLQGSCRCNLSEAQAEQDEFLVQPASYNPTPGPGLLGELPEQIRNNSIIKGSSMPVAVQLKQRVATKEAKTKIEEMKAKILSLRTQKTQLNNRIGDMQSVTTSLKQELVALESALEKLQNENRVLREKDISSDKENPEIIALRELLKQKESEIQEMKLLLEKPTRIWSVSADDPSKPPINLTTTGTTVEENENEVRKGKEENVAAENQQLQESMNVKDGQNSTDRNKEENFTAEYQKPQESMNVKDGQNSTDRNEAENGTAVEDGNQNVISREELLKILDDNPVGENTTQSGASMLDSIERGDNGENNADAHQGEGQIEGGGESVKPKVSQEDGDPKGSDQSNRNQVKDENSHEGELLKVGDGEVANEDHGAIRDGELQKPKNPQDTDGQELSMISKGEMKLEVQPDVPQIGATSRARSRSRSKKGHRRQRMVSKMRELEKSGNSKEGLGDGHYQENADMREEQGGGHSEMHEQSKNEVLGITTNTENRKALEGGEGADSDTGSVETGLIGKNGMGVSSESKLLKPHDPQHHEDAESTHTANGIGKEQRTPHLKLQNSEDGGEGLTTDSIKSEASQLAGDAREQKLGVGTPQEDREDSVSTDTANGIKKEQETSHLKPQESEDGGEGLTMNSIKSEAGQLADDAAEQKSDVRRPLEDQEHSFSTDTANVIEKEQETSQLKPQESEDGRQGLMMDSIKSEAGQLADDAIEQKLDVRRPQEDQKDSESTDTADGIGKEQETSHLKPQDSEGGGEGLTMDSSKSEAGQLAEDTIEQKLDVGRLQEDQEARAEAGGTTGKDADRNEEDENMEVDGAGEQTERNAETEDDNPSLDLELDDIGEHGRENTTEEEEF